MRIAERCVYELCIVLTEANQPKIDLHMRQIGMTFEKGIMMASLVKREEEKR